MMTFRNGRLESLIYDHRLTKQIADLQEYRGRQTLYQKQEPEALQAMRQMAMIQSVESSNRIEGIFVSSARLPILIKEGAAPQNRSEAEVVGYREVLHTIHQHALDIRLNPNTILQLHRDLMRYVGSGGRWKTTDNVVEVVFPDGKKEVRFVPVPAWQTEMAMDELCDSFLRYRELNSVPELVLIAAFILDFLSIHPFPDENGRMARLLVLLLLYQSGYEVGRYISLERIVEDTKDRYYETLYLSSQGWHEGQHHLNPWLEYVLLMVQMAYQRFEERVQLDFTQKRGWKEDWIRAAVFKQHHRFTVADLEVWCPWASRAMLSRVLNKMSHEGVIVCEKRGRHAEWKVIQKSE
ncbi:Fic family protein [Sulfoacidibacillus thermotolerans]|uniref:Fido domain-containing protein n=1 Tax=Sulfoacidibacillus thermotolerans TaxID=1765684 RepID=A0A2U3D5P3_SULT2|nr:Fic family protein [Sulfoacidibacillus thermotolerans]PWI56587.1 hypothetical protein BM613_13005 [Sulfoacidibacillus thermotolerans]